MAKVNYPEELTSLVEEFLTDGVISSKERLVLLKKAETMGVDVDEFDLYIDAQQQKVDFATEVAVNKRKGKTCPYCGGSVPMLSDKCPNCGESITPEATKEFTDIYENLENALVDFKSNKKVNESKAKVEKYRRKAEIYYSNNPKIQYLLEQIQDEIKRVEDSNRSIRKRNVAISSIVTIGCVIICIFLKIWGDEAKENARSRLNSIEETHSSLFGTPTAWERAKMDYDNADNLHWNGIIFLIGTCAFIDWKLLRNKK